MTPLSHFEGDFSGFGLRELIFKGSIGPASVFSKAIGEDDVLDLPVGLIMP